MKNILISRIYMFLFYLLSLCTQFWVEVLFKHRDWFLNKIDDDVFSFFFFLMALISLNN